MARSPQSDRQSRLGGRSGPDKAASVRDGRDRERRRRAQLFGHESRFGTDTLRLPKGDFDLPDFAGDITDIEVVDMRGGEASTAVLSASNVLDPSDIDELTVLGGADDSLEAGAGWTGGGINADGLHGFTQDVGGAVATLLVDPDVPTNRDLVA
jgi:hypothetical protein